MMHQFRRVSGDVELDCGGFFVEFRHGQRENLGDRIGVLDPVGTVGEIDEEARAAGVAFLRAVDERLGDFCAVFLDFVVGVLA